MGKFFQIVGAQPSVHVHDFVEVVPRLRIEFFFLRFNVDWPPRPPFVFPINRGNDRTMNPRLNGIVEQRRVIEREMPRLRVVEQLLELEIRYGVAVLVRESDDVLSDLVCALQFNIPSEAAQPEPGVERILSCFVYKTTSSRNVQARPPPRERYGERCERRFR